MNKLLLLLLLAACTPKAQTSCGFLQDVYGQRISWKNNVPVTLKIDVSFPVEFIPDLVAAAHTWNVKAGRTLIIIDTNAKAFGPYRKDRQNVIYGFQKWDSKRDKQAITTTYWTGDQITEADMKLNLEWFAFYTSQDEIKSGVSIQALFLHELGHVLGLMHIDTERSVMNRGLANMDDRIELLQKETANLACQY